MLLMTYLQNYVSSEKRDMNIKLLNIIRIINEAKTLIKHISCHCKCKFNTTTCNLNQKME